MKTLSVLLLLALGVGAAWWKITWPDGTPADARAQTTLAVDRLRERLVAVRERIALPGVRRDGAATAPADVTDEPSGASPEIAAALPSAPSPDAAEAVSTGSAETAPDTAPSAFAAATSDDDALLARLADVERRLDAASRRETAMLLELEGLRGGTALDGAAPEGDDPENAVADSVPDIRPGLATADEDPSGTAAANGATGLVTPSADVGTRLDALDERLAELAGGLDQRLAALEQRLGASSSGESTVPLEMLTERLDALDERIATLADTASGGTGPNDATRSEPQGRLAAPGERADDETAGEDARAPGEALERTGEPEETPRAESAGRDVEYKIYFERGSTEVSPGARRVLDSFIAQEKNRTTGVSIFGFTDRQGSAALNRRLALERATNVRSYLVQNGLPYEKIRALNGLDEDAAAAILPDKAEDAQQRVVVLFAAQP